MTTTDMRAPRALQVTPVALEQEVRRLLAKYAHARERVLLLRAQPVGSAPILLTGDGPRATIVGCVSPLDVLDQVTRHLESGELGHLVVLTTAEAEELGDGLVSHAVRQRIFAVEPWRLIEESFGALSSDARLSAERWVGEALLDAMPPGGWPKLPGTVLTRDHALRALCVQRLRLDRFGVDAADLDAATLLRWSLDAEAVAAFRTLRDAEREGLANWLAETFPGTAEVLFALVEDGKAGDALALGLVCGALWKPGARAAAQRAQGGVLSYIAGALGTGTKVTDQAVTEFAATTERLIGWMLAHHRDPAAGHRVHTVLDRAETLLAQLGAVSQAKHSHLLRSSFEQRIGAVAKALRSAVGDGGKGGALAEAVGDLRAHALAGFHEHRIRRVLMARRLVQWLAAESVPADRVSGVEATVTAQVAGWGWVDRAHDDIWTGEDVDSGLQDAFRRLHAKVAERRRALDEAFAGRLADWSRTPPDPRGISTIESVLPRVLAPLATAPEGTGRPVLLLVLGGMSAAVAAGLGEQLLDQRWEEYDPLGGKAPEPRRRAVVAALPALTTVSRASLFAGRVTTGGPVEERSAFEGHPAFKGRVVRLFHQSGDAGEALDTDLADHLAEEETTIVAVVLNTINDSLEKGRATSTWRIDDIAHLRPLLDHALNQGRAVIITGDHGHILEHGTNLRRSASQDARHRVPDGPLSEGEVQLAGPRVATDDHTTVALWDTAVRYTAKKGGYYGGASLAEVAVPLMAFLPPGAAPPKGWIALADQAPSWWSVEPSGITGDEPREDARRAKAKPRKGKLVEKPPAGQGTFDIPEAPAEVDLAARLLENDLFKQRHRGVPRPVQIGKIRSAVAALVEAGGLLPLPVLAQRIGEPVVRAYGFTTTLGRILNVDSYPVLQVTDGNRNVRLDITLLRQQFGLNG